MIPWKYQFWHFQMFWWKLPNSSCRFPNHKPVFLQIFNDSRLSLKITPLFWNNKSVFLQILHHSSVSWDITRLYFFSWNFTYFQQKEPIKVQIWWNFTWAVKSLTFCPLIGSFCKNYTKFQLKKYGRVISDDIEKWWKI